MAGTLVSVLMSHSKRGGEQKGMPLPLKLLLRELPHPLLWLLVIRFPSTGGYIVLAAVYGYTIIRYIIKGIHYVGTGAPTERELQEQALDDRERRENLILGHGYSTNEERLIMGEINQKEYNDEERIRDARRDRM